MIVLLLLPLLLLVSGTFLLTRGLRGYAIDDHPVCRACRFDLTGLPPTSTRCPECGADLSTPGAIRTGNRRRRPGMILAGSLLILPALASSTLVILSATSNVDWLQYAPHWYLLRQAKSTTPVTRDLALAEIGRRDAGSLLSDSDISSTLSAALAVQSDRSLPWTPRWGDLVESFRISGKVPDEKWQQYLTSAPTVSLAVRPQVRRGDKLPVRILEGPARSGSRMSLWASVHYQTQPDSDLVKIRDSGSAGSTLSPTGSGSMGYDYELSPELLAKSPDGPKLLHVKAILSLYSNGSPTPDNTPPEATATFDLRANWTLVPADTPTVRAIDDPSLRPTVETSLKVDSISVQPNYPDHVNVNLRINNPPVPLAYKVILRVDGREYPLSSISILAGKNTGWGTGGQAKNLPPTTTQADLILRPDEKVATSTTELSEYWTGEVTFKNIPIKRDRK